MATQKKIVLTAEDRTKGAFRGVQRNLGKLESATAGLQRAFALLAGATGLALVARSFINAADRAVQLENKLKLVTDTSQDLTRVYGKLFKLSKDTRVSFEATSELYARLARSSTQLGLSEEQLLQITESLNQAFAVSGAGIMETASAVRQLGQGLASGRLAGDELRSIMENAPRVAKMIADGMDTSIGQLRRLGSEGRLNAESVTEAILKMGPEVQEEFEKTAGTVGQATTAMSDSWINFVNVVDENTGASGKLAQAINRVGSFMDNLSKSMELGLDAKTTEELNTELNHLLKNISDIQTLRAQIDKARGDSPEFFGIQFDSLNPFLASLEALAEVTEDQYVPALAKASKIQSVLNNRMKDGEEVLENEAFLRKKIAETTKEQEEWFTKALMSAFDTSDENQAIITFLNDLDEAGASLEAYAMDVGLMSTKITAFKNAVNNFKDMEFTGAGFKDPNTGQEALRDQWQQRMTIIDKALETELITHERANELKLQSDKDYTTRLAELQAQSASNHIGNLASMASATKDMSVEAFELWKALAIAQATMNAFLTYTKVLQDPFVPTPLAHGIGVTMMGLSLAYVSKISSMNYPKREYGGSVTRGQTYLVGERGPELFTSNQSGNITPNNQIGGTTNVNFSINTVDARNFDSLLQARRGVIIGMINQAMNRSGQAGIV